MDYFKTKKYKGEFGDENWFPAEEELKKWGIIYQHIIQKPGDAIYIGYKSIH